MATTGNENVIKTESHNNSKIWKYMEAKEDGSLQQRAGSSDPLPKRPDSTSRPLDVAKQGMGRHLPNG